MCNHPAWGVSMQNPFRQKKSVFLPVLDHYVAPPPGERLVAPSNRVMRIGVASIGACVVSTTKNPGIECAIPLAAKGAGFRNRPPTKIAFATLYIHRVFPSRAK